MIIQSKFHDYYDSLAAQFTDKRIVYKRDEEQLIEREVIPKALIKYLRLDAIIVGSAEYECINAIIFCGKIYPFFESCKKYNQITRDYKDPYAHMAVPKKNIYSNATTIHLPEYRGEGIYSIAAEKLNKTIAPIVLLEKNGYRFDATINPQLSRVKFHLHPFVVYQALFQFLAPVEPPMVKTSDSYKVIAHGMDETSFRRDKGGPTRKRKKNKLK